MTTSSTFRHTAHATRAELTCPDWCTLEPSEHEEPRILWDDEYGLVVCITHPGPKFGPFSTDAQTHNGVLRSPWAFLDDTIEFMDSAQVGEHAAHALAVAEWIEAHR